MRNTDLSLRLAVMSIHVLVCHSWSVSLYDLAEETMIDLPGGGNPRARV